MINLFINNIKIEFLNYYIFLSASFILVCLMAFICWIINPSSRRLGKNLPYECGCDSLSTGSDKIEITFYCVIILFVLFEIEFLLVLPLIFNLEILCLLPISFSSLLIFYLCMILPFFYEMTRGAVSFFNKILIVVVFTTVIFLQPGLKKYNGILLKTRSISKQSNKSGNQPRKKFCFTIFIDEVGSRLVDYIAETPFFKKIAVYLLEIIIWIENHIFAKLWYRILTNFLVFFFAYFLFGEYVLWYFEVIVGWTIFLWLGCPATIDGIEFDSSEAAQAVGKEFIQSFKVMPPKKKVTFAGDEDWPEPTSELGYPEIEGGGEGFGSEMVTVMANPKGWHGGTPLEFWEFVKGFLTEHAEAIMWNSYQMCMHWTIFCVFVSVISHWVRRIYYGKGYNYIKGHIPRKSRAQRIAEHEAFIRKAKEVLKLLAEKEKQRKGKGRGPWFPGLIISPWYLKPLIDYPRIKPEPRKHWPRIVGTISKILFLIILSLFISCFSYVLFNNFQVFINSFQVNLNDTQLGCCYVFIAWRWNIVDFINLAWTGFFSEKLNNEKKVIWNISNPVEFNWFIVIYWCLLRVSYTILLYQAMPFVFIDPLKEVICGCPPECFDVTYYQIRTMGSIKHLYPDQYEKFSQCAKALVDMDRKEFLDDRYEAFSYTYWKKVYYAGKWRYQWLWLRDHEYFEIETIWEESVRLLERDTQVAWNNRP